MSGTTALIRGRGAPELTKTRTTWSLAQRQVRLDAARTLDEALERVATAAPDVPAGEWLRGHGWRSGGNDRVRHGGHGNRGHVSRVRGAADKGHGHGHASHASHSSHASHGHASGSHTSHGGGHGKGH